MATRGADLPFTLLGVAVSCRLRWSSCTSHAARRERGHLSLGRGRRLKLTEEGTGANDRRGGEGRRGEGTAERGGGEGSSRDADEGGGGAGRAWTRRGESGNCWPLASPRVGCVVRGEGPGLLGGRDFCGARGGGVWRRTGNS